MGELQSAMRMLGSLPKNLITQYPSGRWGFVGSVHVSLAYRRKDGQPLSDKDCQNIRQFGITMLPHIEDVSFDTKEAAEEAAKVGGE